MINSIVKKLSPNDVGETGAHQAGILIPKQEDILSFFPSLDKTEKNPRIGLVIRDKLDNTRWNFNLIYYNNKLFGGTRNEYRLTGMTRFFRSTNLKPDDELEFSKDDNGSIYIRTIRKAELKPESTAGVLILSSGWKIINI